MFIFFIFFFFFNDTATTEIYTLSLHDALPISRPRPRRRSRGSGRRDRVRAARIACEVDDGSQRRRRPATRERSDPAASGRPYGERLGRTLPTCCRSPANAVSPRIHWPGWLTSDHGAAGWLVA